MKTDYRVAVSRAVKNAAGKREDDRARSFVATLAGWLEDDDRELAETLWSLVSDEPLS